MCFLASHSQSLVCLLLTLLFSAFHGKSGSLRVCPVVALGPSPWCGLVVCGRAVSSLRGGRGPGVHSGLRPESRVHRRRVALRPGVSGGWGGLPDLRCPVAACTPVLGPPGPQAPLEHSRAFPSQRAAPRGRLGPVSGEPSGVRWAAQPPRVTASRFRILRA